MGTTSLARSQQLLQNYKIWVSAMIPRGCLTLTARLRPFTLICPFRKGYLDLSHNNFSGTVPGFIGGLPYLGKVSVTRALFRSKRGTHKNPNDDRIKDSVFLQENKFTGAFPDSFCNQSTERFDGGQAKVVIANCDGPYLKHTNCSCCSNVLYCVNGTAQGFQGVF